MNLVDSSGWLEYFSNGSRAGRFESLLKDTAALLVATVCIYEVFKVILRERGPNDALQAVAAMRRGTVADFTEALALTAARISLDHGIAMADGIILATARAHGATLWTLDADFKNIPDVKYIPAGKPARRQ